VVAYGTQGARETVPAVAVTAPEVAAAHTRPAQGAAVHLVQAQHRAIRAQVGEDHKYSNINRSRLPVLDNVLDAPNVNCVQVMAEAKLIVTDLDACVVDAPHVALERQTPLRGVAILAAVGAAWAHLARRVQRKVVPGAPHAATTACSRA